MQTRAVKVETADLERAVDIAAKVVEALRSRDTESEIEAITFGIARDTPFAPLVVRTFHGQRKDDDWVAISKGAAQHFLTTLSKDPDKNSQQCTLRLSDANLLLTFVNCSVFGQSLLCCAYVGIAMGWMLPADAQQIIDHWDYGEMWRDFKELVAEQERIDNAYCLAQPR